MDPVCVTVTVNPELHHALIALVHKEGKVFMRVKCRGERNAGNSLFFSDQTSWVALVF
jgi:hypothetical protein